MLTVKFDLLKFLEDEYFCTEHALEAIQAMGIKSFVEDHGMEYNSKDHSVVGRSREDILKLVQYIEDFLDSLENSEYGDSVKVQDIFENASDELYCLIDFLVDYGYIEKESDFQLFNQEHKVLEELHDQNFPVILVDEKVYIQEKAVRAVINHLCENEAQIQEVAIEELSHALYDFFNSLDENKQIIRRAVFKAGQMMN